MSVTQAHQILERKRLLQKTPLYLAILGDVALVIPFLALAWSSFPSKSNSGFYSSFIIFSVLVIVRTVQNTRMKRRLEIAELKILQLERAREDEE